VTQPLAAALAQHERAWQTRPLLRRLYCEWYDLIARRLADRRPTVELGSGIGRLREVVPEAVLTDVEPTRWADVVADAEELPYEDASVGNLVLVDVFHHLADPARFLDEAARVLRPGGRAVLLEPYCSPLSRQAYRFHHERLDLRADPFEADPRVATGAMDANIATTTLAFFRREAELRARWPAFELRERRLLSLVVYPLTGGFSRRSMLPRLLYRPLTVLERALAPLNRLAALRCLLVLERR
jgi:SAM-dependent methyltransferase